MIKTTFIDRLNNVRTDMLETITKLNESDSFRSVLDSSDIIRRRFRELEQRMNRKIQQPFDKRFVIAIAGSSGHGKTTIIDEIFPGLSKRGWLKTDVTDTTSQALRIEYGEDLPDNPPVTVNSWTLAQIKALFNDDTVKSQNNANKIKVQYAEDRVIVDGHEALFKEKEARKFRFPKSLEVCPFNKPYSVPDEKLGNDKFISALTVKQGSGKISTDPIISVDGRSFNSLQLRAVVKDVVLKDEFENIQRWLDLDDDDLQNLVFVDTPGIGTSGGMKDEVLTYTLEAKSRRILLELLANDELDIVVHLVLCGRQSDFSSIYRALEETVGRGEMADLSERIVVAINGTNIFFSNPDLRRHMKESGDHLDTAIDDNILEKMVPGQNFRPEALCFMDSKRIVEGEDRILGHKSYEKTYAQYRDTLEGWLEPNTKSYEFLDKYGCVDSFRENIEAITDPEDCGQGFMIKQIHRLIETKGERLLVKKYLCRTKLIDCAKETRSMLAEHYSDDGELNNKATHEAIAQMFATIGDNQLAIDTFCADAIDPEIDAVIDALSQTSKDDDWLIPAFEKTCTILGRKLSAKTSVSDEAKKAFWQTLVRKAQDWGEEWGYVGSAVPCPANSNNRTAILGKHVLKVHAREMIYQFKTGACTSDNSKLIQQTDDDKRLLRETIQLLDKVLNEVDSICGSVGVNR